MLCYSPGEDGAAAEGATQPAPGKKERSRKNGSKPSSLSSSTGSSGANNGQSTEEEVAEYWNKLQSQHSEPEGYAPFILRARVCLGHQLKNGALLVWPTTRCREAAGTKPRRERRRGGGKRNAAHPAAAAEQHVTPQVLFPTLLSFSLCTPAQLFVSVVRCTNLLPPPPLFFLSPPAPLSCRLRAQRRLTRSTTTSLHPTSPRSPT